MIIFVRRLKAMLLEGLVYETWVSLTKLLKHFFQHMTINWFI